MPLPRWPPLAASALGCLALAVVAATFLLGSMAGQLNAQTVASSLVALAFALLLQPSWAPALVAARLQDSADPDEATADLGETVQQALEPEHLSLWVAEVAS